MVGEGNDPAISYLQETNSKNNKNRWKVKEWKIYTIITLTKTKQN